MKSPASEVCLAIIALEIIGGLGSNAFIIFSLTLMANAAPYNKILIALNVSNMFYTIFMPVNVLIYIFCPSYNLTHISKMFHFFTLSSIMSSSWLTAALCFFYFIKILQFQSGILAWLKMKIDTMVPGLILGVEMFCLLESAVGSYLFINNFSPNGNVTTPNVTSDIEKLRVNFVLIVISVPFLLAISLTLASALSLKLHNDRVRRNMGHTSVMDYRGAIHTMACLIIFYAIIYLTVIVSGRQLFEDLSWGYWMCIMILTSFSGVQSGLLINGNPKLIEAWKKMFSLS